jgi:hypothetical protein
VALQPFPQRSFAAGELCSLLHSRADLAKYFVALRRAHNFFLAPEGAAMNRPGSLIVREAKDSAAGVDRHARFIPFVFSEVLGQSYILEFGEHYIRFHVGGATIADPVNPAIPYEVATPYAAADLGWIKYAQKGDIVTLTCRGYDPRDLKRVAHNSWTITTRTFNVPAPNSTVYLHGSILDNAEDSSHPKRQWDWEVTELWQDQDGLTWETSPVPVSLLAVYAYDTWVSRFTYPIAATVTFTRDGTTKTYRSKVNGNNNHQPADLGAWWEEYDLAILPTPIYTNPLPSEVVLYPDRKAQLFVQAAWGLTVGGGTSRLVGRRAYRGRGDFFGYVDEFLGLSVTDVGDLPNTEATPPTGRNPFAVYNSSNALVRTEQPLIVTYQDERIIFPATVQRPETVFLSRTGDYYNFDQHSPVLDDDAFEAEVAGRLREEIRWAIGGEQLLLGTQSSVYSLHPPDTKVLTPTEREVERISSAGASWLDPLEIASDAGTAVLYVRSKGCGVRDLAFNGGKWAGSDLSVLARHLFDGFQVTAWTYQRDPWSVIWAVRSDGKMLSLTYLREQEVWGWAWHDTQGVIEDVCSIPEGTEDAVYLLVKRQKGDGTWHRYVERMASRRIPVANDGTTIDPNAGAEALFLDCAITVRDVAAADPGPTISGLGHLEGLTVVALADGNVIRTNAAGGALVVTGGHVVLPDEKGEGFDVVHVGLPMLAEAELLDLELPNASIRNQVKVVGKVAFAVQASRGIEVAETSDSPDSDWVAWDQRALEDEDVAAAPPLFTGLVELATFSTWNKRGRAAIRQRDPLPCTLLSVTREAEIGGS